MKIYTLNEIEAALRRAYVLGYRDAEQGKGMELPRASDLIEHDMTGNFALEPEPPKG
jgi:hypothetical protein